MQPYGYKSSISIYLKIRRGGICYCLDCEADENQERKNKKRHRKRARRWAKLEIKKQLLES